MAKNEYNNSNAKQNSQNKATNAYKDESQNKATNSYSNEATDCGCKASNKKSGHCKDC